MPKLASRHIKRTLLTLGAILFIAVTLGAVAETTLRSMKATPAVNLEGAETAPDVNLTDSISIWGSLSLAIASVFIAFPVAGALVAIPALGSHLMHKLYVTRDLSEAHDALNGIVFGRFRRRPFLVIKEGRVTVGEDSFAWRVGGPATVIIYNDTAVVTEQYGCTKRVLGTGVHDIERFEKIWEIIDLRPQRWVLPVSALTKEGVPVSCEADISFQIDDHPQEPGWKAHTEEPYPFAEDAVFRAATSKWIREPEREDNIMTWVGRVMISFTEGMLRNILAEYRLDWLIAPPQPSQKHPREEIRQRLEESLRESARKVGAKLLSVEIGKIEVKARDEGTSKQLSEIVSQQWVEAWHVDWEARALASRAEGEARLLQTEMAQIQVQAEMVVNLTEALQSAIMSQGAVKPYILALRFVEALRWMSYNIYTREFMPPEVVQRLKRMQELLEDKVETPVAQREQGQSHD